MLKNGNNDNNSSQTSPTSQASTPSQASPSSKASAPGQAIPRVLKAQNRWETLHFYQKADALYQLTFAFTQRFLTRGDRTVDQMVQAARSGKQNIVEGTADGVTSTELELKLLNVARASIKELKEDYSDYLATRALPLWSAGHRRYDAMLAFCRQNNRPDDYRTYFDKWTDEEMANSAYTLCHMIDRMMTTYIGQLEQQFVTEGGIRERMTAARLGYRNSQRERIAALEADNAALRAEVARLQEIISSLSSPSSLASPSSPTSQASQASNTSKTSPTSQARKN